MPVYILTDSQKKIIGERYSKKIYSQQELARHYSVSTRTINRVLVELGLATPVARIQGEAHQVMQLLKKHGMDFNGLKGLLESQVVHG